MIAETARLATELTLKDGLTPGLSKTTGAVGKFDTRLGKAGKSVSKFGGTLKKAGAIAGGALVGGLAIAVKTGIEDLAKLEDATTAVDGAIKQMGLTGQVTSKQVADWANEIESDIHAAFDDKAITAATATLIRFGKVTPKNLRQSLVVMTDLAAKTGDVDSAASLLAKALADPTKAAGKLARQGIILTDAQEKQIKAFVKAGKVAEAQKVILDAVAKSTKGAADASQGKYQKALSTLADVSEDARKALAEGFLPVIQRVADKLSKILADPKAVQSIRDLGNGLAGAFDKAVDFAEKVPWGQVGDGLGKAAGFAKTLFDAFASMPSEVQATIIALAGLNKLSGGAVTGIVSELGKGLIKGVLGMTAGVVNIQAGVVNGPGGPSTPTPTGGVVLPVVGAVATLDMVRAQEETNRYLNKVYGTTNKDYNVTKDILSKLGIVNDSEQNTAKSVNAAKNAITANERGEGAKHRAKLSALQAQEQRSLVAFRAGERATLGVKSAVNSKLASANAKLDAIRHKKTSFRTIVNVKASTSVSVRDINQKTTTSVRFNTHAINQAY